MRDVDGAVAATCNGVYRCVVGTSQGGPEDGFVGAFVEPIGAERVDEDVGGCSSPEPDVGKVARRVRGRLGRSIVLAGDDYVGSSNGATVKERFRG